MMSESTEHVLNEQCLLILVKTIPSGEDESRVRIPRARMAPPALDVRPRQPGAQLPGRGKEWQVLQPLPAVDCLPMFFFKAKHLCCQERVCLSLGDSGCQDWENSKHVKNSSASRLRGCNFLLKCRLCSGQRAGVCLCSLQPAAEAAEGSKMLARGRQRVPARPDRLGENLPHSNSDETGGVFKHFCVCVIRPHQARPQIG